jgi:hypothetical protein
VGRTSDAVEDVAATGTSRVVAWERATLPAEPHARLRDAGQRLREALDGQRGRDLSRAASVVEVALGDVERMLASAPPPALPELERAITRAERVLAAWTALLAF